MKERWERHVGPVEESSAHGSLGRCFQLRLRVARLDARIADPQLQSPGPGACELERRAFALRDA